LPSTPATLIREACITCWAGRTGDTDGVRDDLREYVTGQLADSDAVLMVDETGDLEKGV
jgi:SRSO17 transposase